jgi:hypothetical protein
LLASSNAPWTSYATSLVVGSRIFTVLPLFEAHHTPSRKVLKTPPGAWHAE